MIKEVIEHINGLVTLDVSKFYGLVEKVTRYAEPVTSYPAEYVGGGDFSPINFDFSSSLIYHRVNGSQSSQESESATGCGMDLIITQPMRLVLYCSRDMISREVYGVDKIVHNIRQDISFNNSSSLSASLKSDYVSVVVNSVNMDFYSVWADEFNNVDYSLNSDKCLIAFGYTIEIKVEKDCYVYECN